MIAAAVAEGGHFWSELYAKLQNPWVAIGMLGQAIFFCRFLVQWIVSERRGRSTIPIAFWWLSIAGSVLVLAYAIMVVEPVLLVGQSVGLVVYARNLMMIRRERIEEAF